MTIVSRVEIPFGLIIENKIYHSHPRTYLNIKPLTLLLLRFPILVNLSLSLWGLIFIIPVPRFLFMFSFHPRSSSL